jgi:hypothetical protein
MKWLYITVSILVILALVALGAYFLIRPSTPAASTTPGQGTNPFGTPAGSTPGATRASSTPTLLITTTDGNQLTVPDFTQENQPSTASPVNGYRVAGSEIAGSGGAGFQVAYFPDQSYFDIAILAEPLGQNRFVAEEALRSRLGLSQTQMCSLNVKVFVLGEANETFAGRDLGLSYCPGATVLPN